MGAAGVQSRGLHCVFGFRIVESWKNVRARSLYRPAQVQAIHGWRRGTDLRVHVTHFEPHLGSKLWNLDGTGLFVIAPCRLLPSSE